MGRVKQKPIIEDGTVIIRLVGDTHDADYTVEGHFVEGQESFIKVLGINGKCILAFTYNTTDEAQKALDNLEAVLGTTKHILTVN